MVEQQSKVIKRQYPYGEPTRIPTWISERLARQGVREAAQWHKFKNVKMSVADDDGTLKLVDAQVVLDALDEADRRSEAEHGPLPKPYEYQPDA